MDGLERSRRDLVIANRILAGEGVIDASGHVSLRHPDRPDRYLISHSRSPELVESGDIVELTLDGHPLEDKRPLLAERFIHGAIYEARPDVQAVIHSHAETTLPFGITHTKLQAVIHVASDIGFEVPVWDIAEQFGNHTDLLVTNIEQGRDLARCLGENQLVVMRGHGFTAASRSLILAVRMAVYLPRNARVLLAALRLGKGKIKPLSRGEIEVRMESDPNAPPARRSWDYWATKAGCAHLL